MGLFLDLPNVRKKGWPWDQETSSNIYEKNDVWPKISIVTPSYNQVGFIEETVRSVLLQNYPNLEYIIIDGGSTDNSQHIIKKYEKYLSFWVSESDNGQSHAINKGFKIAKGEIICWLNSDDYLLPGALHKVGKILKNKNNSLLFGNAKLYIQEKNKYIDIDNYNRYKSIGVRLPFYLDFITQPSVFWTSDLLFKIGLLNEKFHYAFDSEWFAKAYETAHFIPSNEYFSVYRIHRDHKSSSGGKKRTSEILEFVKKIGYVNHYNTLIELRRSRNKFLGIYFYMKKANLKRLSPILYKLFWNRTLNKYNLKEISGLIDFIRILEN